MRNVRIVKDYLPHNKTNFCLHLIISEIGKGYSFKNGKSLEGDDCFKVGLNLINRRLHKFHKKATRNLTYAKVKKFSYSEIDDTVKYVWVISSKKAPKIFEAINALLIYVNNRTIKESFKTAYKLLRQYGAEKRGDSLIAFPYYHDIRKINDLSQVVKEIEVFSKYY